MALERVLLATGTPYEPKLVKLHKGEQFQDAFLAINPNGQVPVLVQDGQPLTQIVAIVDHLDRQFPKAGLLPTDPWERAQAMSRLAWFNNSVHPTFTQIFRPTLFSDDEAVQQGLKAHAIERFRMLLARIDAMAPAKGAFWHGGQAGPLDAYAFTLLRWGGFAGIAPDSLPRYKAQVEAAMQHPAMSTVVARERVGLDTYKPA